MLKLPHPIPYQGSKRNLAPVIGPYVPEGIETWYEPFAGSAAMALWVARHRGPRRIVLGASLAPLMQLWDAILRNPRRTAARYEELWTGQKPGDPAYFNRVRERFNEGRDPVDLLYLLCRCVKNAVRFNARGHFTQSVDKRRLGMHPAKMHAAIEGASELLRGKTRIRSSDWLDTLADAGPNDLAYMDPPYFGTSTGKDKRYAEWMSQERLVGGLASLNARGIRFALSYDGMCGEKVYGPPLPDDLGMTRLHLHAGRSSQATLNGGTDETVESLYLSRGLPALSPDAPGKGGKDVRQMVLAYRVGHVTLASAVLSICVVEGGAAANQIPSRAVMRGTFRTHDPAVRDAVERGIHRITAGIAQAFGTPAAVEVRHTTAATVNAPADAALAAAAAQAANLPVRRDPPPSMAAEDFGWYLTEKPGAFVWIGNGPAAPGRELHNPGYDFNDAVLPHAATWLAAVAKHALAG